MVLLGPLHKNKAHEEYRVRSAESTNSKHKIKHITVGNSEESQKEWIMKCLLFCLTKQVLKYSKIKSKYIFSMKHWSLTAREQQHTGRLRWNFCNPVMSKQADGVALEQFLFYLPSTSEIKLQVTNQKAEHF